MTDQSNGADPYGRPPAPAPGSDPWARDQRPQEPSWQQQQAPQQPAQQQPSPVPTWYADTQPVTSVQERPLPPAAPSGQVAWAEAQPWDGRPHQSPDVDTLGRPSRRRGGGGLVTLAVVLSLIAGLLGGLLGSLVADGTDLAGRVGLGDDDRGAASSDGSAAGTGGSTGVADEPAEVGEVGSVAEIAARVLPSVVSIRVVAGQGEGTGSGFVIDEEGLVVTNNHVVAAGGDEPAEDIVVELANGSQATAEVVGVEPSYDIAVLRIDPAEAGAPLVALPFGDSDSVVVGEQVVAIGAPLGLDSTVTTGIVSALNRPVSAGDAQQTAFINAIQTDAAINPGNSGGPLVNMRGEVVGVNSAIAQAPGGQAGGSIGLGFSIPSNQAQRTATELIETGVATFPVVGVLLDRTYTGEGVRIVTEQDATAENPPVTPGGPAAEAGLQAGDTILAFEGRPVTESDELVVAIRAQEPGDEVTLTVRRGEEVFDVDLTLQAAEQD
ncbi:S1C family serine protease [Aquipuribacter hungaricus]|uniref:S1C family serine protease n=1 Tax=Aquipuribacter hungaricus TaxID=545624 RepID=A0ABV7WAD4_9MICO